MQSQLNFFLKFSLGYVSTGKFSETFDVKSPSLAIALLTFFLWNDSFVEFFVEIYFNAEINYIYSV